MNRGKNIKNSGYIPTETAEELYENAPCGYVSFSTDGTIFNINSTLLSWLGFSKKEVVGIKKFNSLFKIGGKIFFETHFFPLIRIQGFIKEIHFEIVRKDKSTFPGLLNVNEISGSTGGSKTYRATVFDITDRKIYENELLSAKKKAESASRAKAEFLSTISHEIRTPLNAILGIGNLIQKTPLNEQQQEYARILLLSADNLLSLVNNLLDLSKIEANKVKLEQKPLDLADMIEVLVTTFKVKAREKNIDLLTDFEEDLPKDLIGDQVKLNQILTNLLGNAIKFTDSGHVKLRITTIERKAAHAVLRFEVSDTGMGIPEDKLETIFSEFSQASYEVNLNYGGTGLGLAISQKLLKLYKSEMQVASKQGEGSKFYFHIKFRLNKEQVKKRALASKKEFPGLFESARILIVDDNPVNIYIISEYLNEWNLDNDAAESGSRALELVQEKEYDLILMDLHMPNMDGYETSKAIRNLNLPRQPIIIALSASGRGDLNIKQKRAGINDYVPKPFRPEELFEALGHHLEISQNEPENTVPLESTLEEQEEVKEEGKAKDSALRSSLFDLSQFIKMANNQPEYLEKFIHNTANAFEEYKKNFQAAMKENSSTKVKELLHKSTMSIFYIKANQLTGLLEECVELLSEKEQDKSRINKKELEVIAHFDQLIAGLRSVNAYELLDNHK